ncbi:MAG: succinate--CoA ligase subunit alpha [Alphaproteobacteria bacterium]|nr:succinate--CoA ligase subunit alpha [Alphaproteobacteria bacterium]
MIKFPDQKTPILCQGITGTSGAAHTERAIAYGSHVVAGISREKNLTTFLDLPVFATVKDAVQYTKPDISVVFSNPSRVYADTEEAIKARIPMIICTTTHVPYHDIMKMKVLAQKYKVCLIGPASPGIVVPDEVLVGNMPAHLFPKGHVGIISRSSSLCYEFVQQLRDENLGVSTCVGIGSGAILCTSFVPIMKAMLNDDKTKSILIIGKINSEFEVELATFVKKQKIKKPIFIYLAGKPDKRIKQSVLGASTQTSTEIADYKKRICAEAGMIVLDRFDTVGKCVKERLG